MVGLICEGSEEEQSVYVNAEKKEGERDDDHGWMCVRRKGRVQGSVQAPASFCCVSWQVSWWLCMCVCMCDVCESHEKGREACVTAKIRS